MLTSPPSLILKHERTSYCVYLRFARPTTFFKCHEAWKLKDTPGMSQGFPLANVLLSSKCLSRSHL